MPTCPARSFAAAARALHRLDYLVHYELPAGELRRPGYQDALQAWRYQLD